jgi:NIMA (never in mitosis gene a)-related kinase
MIFPPRLLGIFIDIGNYRHEIQAYETVVLEFNKLSDRDYKSFCDNIEKFSDFIKAGTSTAEKFGNYETLEIIGKGAFGVVYLCKLGDARYAIKEIPFKDVPQRNIEKPMPTGKSTGPKSEMMSNLEDYFREVKIYKDLDHQNIIRYYDSFAERENLYIVMEYVDGFTLSEFIKIQSEKVVSRRGKQANLVSRT